MKSFRRQFRHLRTRLGLTQAEAGRIIGVAGNTVARWENNVLHPLPPMQFAAMSKLDAYRRDHCARHTRAHSSTASSSRAWNAPRTAEGGRRRGPDG